MTPSMVGPLAVETYIDTAASRLVLRHAGGDLSFSIVDPTGTLKHLRPFLPVAKVAARPRSETCEAAGCGKPIEQAGHGRPRRYCDKTCGIVARREARDRKEGEERQVGRPPTSRLMARMREQLQRGAA